MVKIPNIYWLNTMVVIAFTAGCFGHSWIPFGLIFIVWVKAME